MYNTRMKLSLGEKLDGAKGGLSFTVTVACYLALSLIAAIALSAAGLIDGEGNYVGDAVYVAFLVSPVAIAASLALSFRFGRLSFGEVYSFKCKPVYYAVALLLIFGLLFSLSALNGYFVEFLKLFGYRPKLTENSLPNLDGWRILSALLVIAVLPAVAEEALFRGFLLRNAEEGAGTVRGVLIVGFLFALFHGSPEQTIYQFVCGCLFALLAVRSGSILPSVVMHFLNNALIILFTAFGLTDEAGDLALPYGVNIALIVLSALCLAAAVVLLVLDKTPVKKRRHDGVKRVFLWAAPGIAVMALLWILGLFGL